MLHIERTKQRRVRPGVLLGAFITLVVGSAAVYGYDKWALQAETTGVQSTSQVKPAPQPAKVESRMLVIGDTFFGRYIHDWSMASSLAYAYPFQRLSEFQRDKYDAWVADLVCPMTNNPKKSSAEQEATLTFDCDPRYLTEAKKWFTIIDLGNNHIDNQGAAGFRETQTHLEEHGIQYFGHYDPEAYDDICDVISMPARATMSDATVKQVKLPIVWCGYHGVFKTPSADSIAVMQRYAPYFPVITIPHSGAEYAAAPDQMKVDLYRRLIDGGADVAIGDHSHWVQTTEAYKGHLITYSLGNFLFDQQYNQEVTRSAVLDMTVSVDAKDNPDLKKWITLGAQCSAYRDSCLATAKEQNLHRLVVKYHFAMTGSDDSGKLVKKMTAQQIVTMKQRLQWQQTISGLSGNNSGE